MHTLTGMGLTSATNSVLPLYELVRMACAYSFRNPVLIVISWAKGSKSSCAVKLVNCFYVL